MYMHIFLYRIIRVGVLQIINFYYRIVVVNIMKECTCNSMSRKVLALTVDIAYMYDIVVSMHALFIMMNFCYSVLVIISIVRLRRR